jgi:hypothetical protein
MQPGQLGYKLFLGRIWRRGFSRSSPILHSTDLLSGFLTNLPYTKVLHPCYYCCSCSSSRSSRASSFTACTRTPSTALVSSKTSPCCLKAFHHHHHHHHLLLLLLLLLLYFFSSLLITDSPWRSAGSRNLVVTYLLLFSKLLINSAEPPKALYLPAV